MKEALTGVIEVIILYLLGMTGKTKKTSRQPVPQPSFEPVTSDLPMSQPSSSLQLVKDRKVRKVIKYFQYLDANSGEVN
jgi:hypothetical protein